MKTTDLEKTTHLLEYKSAIEIINNKISARKKDQYLFMFLAILSVLLLPVSLVFVSTAVLCTWQCLIHLELEKKTFATVVNSMEYMIKKAELSSQKMPLMPAETQLPNVVAQVDV